MAQIDFATRPCPYKGYEWFAQGERSFVYLCFDIKAVSSTFGYDPNEIGFSAFYIEPTGHKVVVDVKDRGDGKPVWVAYRTLEKVEV